MADAVRYTRRLIEVDLPIRQISEHARRRQGHLAGLHMWWARRPASACRAVLIAALLPDPTDPTCPQSFIRSAASQLKSIRDRRGGQVRDWNNPSDLRDGLLEFVAQFSSWDNSNDPDFIKTTRELIAAAHSGLGPSISGHPLVVDPFAGGAAIPLEALRIGADAYARDLNPVSVLINKTVLEYAPEFGERLPIEVERWGRKLLSKVQERLGRYYPS